MPLYYGVSVARQDVKRIKTLLEQDQLRHKTLDITQDADAERGQRMIIPTSIEASDEHEPEALLTLDCPLVQLDCSAASTKDNSNALTRAFEAAAHELPDSFWRLHALSATATFNAWAPASIIYPPMLLLKPSTLSHAPFAALLYALESSSTQPTTRTAFWAALANAMHVTHVALDAPVPASSTTSANTLRTPLHFRPLHGDFGPPAPPACPGDADFAAALWVQTTQHGLLQTWAPRHCMFSAGNVREKARVRRVASSSSSSDSDPIAAVDLFAGIGYFAFSYAAARGVAIVLAWDLNPWSCEALRRGAAANGFACASVPVETLAPGAEDAAYARDVLLPHSEGKGARLLVANESNAHAGMRVRALRRASALPPVRHVNCGMLPSADFAWRVACQVLDARGGGWLHLHESARVDAVSRRAEEIRDVVKGYVRGISWGVEVDVEIVEVVRVKSIAPRTVHVVVDLFVPGCGRDEWDV